jgi:CRP-like cAMP-binding protein
VPSKAIQDRPLDKHPFVIKLSSHAPLNADDVKALGRVINHRLTVKKGKDIIVQGFEYKGLDIIETGFAIRYTLLHKGGRQIINTLLPGDIVGFPGSFFDRSIFSVMAATEMSVHRISFDTFVELCRRPNIAIALIWFAARESAICAHHLVDAGRRSPLERVAHFILEMHSRLKAVGWASENAFEIPLSQEGIGDAVGLSAPHVNRMLSELKHEGLIAVEGHEIKILDRAALQIIAEFDPSYLVRTSFQQHLAKR